MNGYVGDHFSQPKLQYYKKNQPRILHASVMAGSPDQDADESYKGSQWSNSTQIYYHPDFEKNTYANDIAMIRVDPPFNTTSEYQSIATGYFSETFACSYC